MSTPGQFRDKPRRDPSSPRRVRGGVRCESKVWPPEHLSWLARAFAALLFGGAERETVNLAFDYARKGQTRRIEALPGRLEAVVQGHRYTPNTATIAFPALSHAEWDRVIEAISDEPAVAAKLLASEMPRSIDQLFASCGFDLLPSTAARLTITHTEPEHDALDHHALCVAVLATEMLEKDPFLVFTLRGLASEELIERLRQRRSALSTVGRSTSLQGQPRVSGGLPPLEDSAINFWTLGADFDHFDTTPRSAKVTHPMLRRLGASPFSESKFPLVGLLATCYDAISQDALAEDNDTHAGTPSDAAATNTSGRSAPNSSASETAPVRTAAEVVASRIAARRAAKPRAAARAKKPGA